MNSSVVGLFLFGLSSVVHVHITGELFLTDLLTLPILLISVIPRWRRLPRRLLRPLLAFMALWFVSLVVTDLYRVTPVVNLERGWFRILFFAATFLCIAALSEFRIGRLMAYAAGLAVAHLIGAALSPDAFERVQPWKFGFATPITTLIVIIVSLPFRSRLGIRAVPLVVMAAANLFLGFRSLFGILIGAVGSTLLTLFTSRRVSARRPVRVSTVLLLAAFGTIAVVGTVSSYSALASRGILGKVQQEKYEEQTEGTGGLLFSDRSEFFVAIKAIEDSPIIGHGSWAADRTYVLYQVLMLRQHGFRADLQNFSSDLIPSHSYILGAWVEAGLAGGVFWAVVLVLTVTGLVRLIGMRSVATPFAAFALWTLLWNIPFSPFGADGRLYVAGQLCVVIWSFGTAMPAVRRRVARRQSYSAALRGARG